MILTSGTTGTPRGAPRREAGLDAAVALLSRIPIKRGWRVHVAAPLFHTWGLAHLLLAMLMETSTVLTRRFDPEECLKLSSMFAVDELVVIPVMLQRILHLPDDVRAKYDLSGVKVVATSGSALAGDLATEWMDAFGDNLYNTYGSTEVAYATIASPRTCARRPARPASHPWAPRSACTTTTTGRSRPGPPGASSWATACCSRATPVAVARRSSTA